MKEYDQISLIIKLIARWHSMRQRCGGRSIYVKRGITVCEEWSGSKGIEPFVRWGLENGFHPILVLDRKNNDMGYSPDNCRWITPKENSNNTSTNVWVEYKGKQYTVKELSEHADCIVAYKTLHARIKIGVGVEEAVLTPTNKGGNRWDNSKYKWKTKVLT